MRKKPVKYSVGEIGRVRLIKDQLPPRKKLVARDAKRGGSQTDWKAAAEKPLPSGRDPDDAMAEIDWATAELPLPRRKAHVTLRLDADLVGWFRAQGNGYQTRINAILRKYFEQNVR